MHPAAVLNPYLLAVFTAFLSKLAKLATMSVD
jgi:hypothetical protein